MRGRDLRQRLRKFFTWLARAPLAEVNVQQQMLAGGQRRAILVAQHVVQMQFLKGT